MADRYHVEVPIEGAAARLTGAEAHHLAHVMRAKPGDAVTLFDGSGAEFSARVERVGRAEIELAVLAREVVDRELPVAITLAVALPKGDRQRWLVEKSVELGVARFVPLESARAGERTSQATGQRLHRAVIEAAKQCGRNRLMEIAPPQALADFVVQTPRDCLRWIMHPGGDELQSQINTLSPAAPPRQVALAVGPEGGFTEDEIATATAAGWHVVGLGKRVLRVETAALAVVAALALRFDRA